MTNVIEILLEVANHSGETDQGEMRNQAMSLILISVCGP